MITSGYLGELPSTGCSEILPIQYNLPFTELRIVEEIDAGD